MKLITTIIAAAGLLVTSALAGQSDPFYLVLHSDNSTLDGKALFSGHEGAGIEGLLVGVDSPPPKADNISYTYQYNTTASQPNIGILTWEITVNGGALQISQGMDIYPDASTNVGVALFGLGDEYLYVSFDSNHYMVYKSYYDDCTNPPSSTNNPTNLDRWYICLISELGYTYYQLSWVYGSEDPQNPTCQKVSVERVFVD